MTTERIPMARPDIQPADMTAVMEVLRSGRISQGPFLAAFEQGLADYVGASYSVGVSSGTAALMLALDAVGVGPGDEVITVSMSFIATANAIIRVGATPVFIDVRSDDLNMDPDAIAAAVTDRTRAVVVVHLFGQMADMQAVCAAADAYGLPVIEDACEALGARTDSGYAGTVGAAGAFGFYANKPLTTAEGGMLVSNDSTFIETCMRLRNQGRDEDGSYRSGLAGFSARMSELHAALGTTQLERLSCNLEQRRTIANHYRELLHDVVDLELPTSDSDNNQISWFTYPLRLSPRLVKAREQIRDELAATGIDTRNYFFPIHTLPFYREMPGYNSAGSGTQQHSLAVTEFESARMVALPLFPGLSAAQVEFVAANLRRVIEHGNWQ